VNKQGRGAAAAAERQALGADTAFMSFTMLQPEVAGGWGPKTVVDVSVHPPRVARLHYEFDGWLGDDLLECFPCFVVSNRLARELERSNLTGFVLGDVDISTTPEFDELYPNRHLPAFSWLKIAGRAGVDDFGISAEHRLVASARAMDVLRRFTLDRADQTAYAESPPNHQSSRRGPGTRTENGSRRAAARAVDRQR
jgi:hypothetical protein